MYSSEFTALITEAKEKALVFYQDKQNANEPNPYYVGFGNPNSNILILGKEQGFKKDKLDQLFDESINNPTEWAQYIENNTPYSGEKYPGSTGIYLNAFCPYSGKMPGGHTWSKYGEVLRHILDKPLDDNRFLKHSFISELNHVPSKKSQISKFTSHEREAHLRHPFYKGFDNIILACGDYLSQSRIEDIFQVRHSESKSQPYMKLEIFRSEKRTLIHTRQLSNSFKNDLLKSIANEIAPKS